MGRPRLQARPVHPPAENGLRRSTIISGSPTPATTASRSSTPTGKLLRVWGKEGSGPGELYYPYDLALADDDTLYVCEFGNHRVQKFTRDGRSLGCFGVEGRGEGQFYNPWALVRDSQGMVYVLDTNNHRVQVVKM